MIAADKVGPFGRRWIMTAKTGVPDAVEMGDESVGDVRIAKDEGCFFDDDLHGRYEGRGMRYEG